MICLRSRFTDLQHGRSPQPEHCDSTMKQASKFIITKCYTQNRTSAYTQQPYTPNTPTLASAASSIMCSLQFKSQQPNENIMIGVSSQCLGPK